MCQSLRNCEICGLPLPVASAKGGRPAMKHTECKRLADALSTLQSQLGRTDLKMTATAAKRMRSLLWGLANQTNDMKVPHPGGPDAE